MPDKVLFLTLKTFSATGGIEKVSRIMGKALYERSVEQDGYFEICSMYDKQTDAVDNPYFPAENFRGFGIRKLSFIRAMVATGIKNDVVMLSHINLLLIGWMIKKISPKTKIILLAHGIEVWYKLNARTRMMLKACDHIIAVSQFTKKRIEEDHGFDTKKCSVLNNCLDPYLPLPSVKNKRDTLLKKYGFSDTDCILMTLTRMSSKERYKGYDKVIEAIAELKNKSANIKYLVAGSYDKQEKEFLDKLISRLNLQDNIVLAGFIKDEELENHFAMSDIYVMPSQKEGFGIVFIEAMYYGLPVIAGNMDGSVDALLSGQLGQLVNPNSTHEVAAGINNILQDKKAFMPNRDLLEKHFGYEAYKQKLQSILN